MDNGLIYIKTACSGKIYFASIFKYTGSCRVCPQASAQCFSLAPPWKNKTYRFRERYLKPLGRRMNIFEGERGVLARVEGSYFVGPGNL